MSESEEDFERPQLEPKGDHYRLVKDWFTDCKGCAPAVICVPCGFETDGASIPRWLWNVCGSPMDTPRIYAAIVHDYLYSVGGATIAADGVYMKMSRKSVDKLYRDYQIAMGRFKLWAEIEYRAIRMCGGSHWTEDEK